MLGENRCGIGDEGGNILLDSKASETAVPNRVIYPVLVKSELNNYVSK